MGDVVVHERKVLVLERGVDSDLLFDAVQCLLLEVLGLVVEVHLAGEVGRDASL